MKIENISKSAEKVTMTLNKDELVLLCNTMYYAEKASVDEVKRELFHKVYADLITAKDLCLYGRIDDIELNFIMRERNLSKVRNVKDYDKAD